MSQNIVHLQNSRNDDKNYENKDYYSNYCNFERKILENKESLTRTISLMKGTAKCLIPVIGYIWFVKSGEIANCAEILRYSKKEWERIINIISEETVLKS